MEATEFDHLPVKGIKTRWFSIAMLNNRRVWPNQTWLVAEIPEQNGSLMVTWRSLILTGFNRPSHVWTRKIREWWWSHPNFVRFADMPEISKYFQLLACEGPSVSGQKNSQPSQKNQNIIENLHWKPASCSSQRFWSEATSSFTAPASAACLAAVFEPAVRLARAPAAKWPAWGWRNKGTSLETRPFFSNLSRSLATKAKFSKPIEAPTRDHLRCRWCSKSWNRSKCYTHTYIYMYINILLYTILLHIIIYYILLYTIIATIVLRLPPFWHPPPSNCHHLHALTSRGICYPLLLFTVLQYLLPVYHHFVQLPRLWPSRNCQAKTTRPQVLPTLWLIRVKLHVTPKVPARELHVLEHSWVRASSCSKEKPTWLR